MLLMTATNLFSVSSYGEFEFWFAGIKVATIVRLPARSARCTRWGCGRIGTRDFSNLHAHGGFFPNGVHGVFAAVVVVIFSMVGAEVATIAAAETPDPERAVQRATNAVAARIAIFFVGSIFLLTVILPWNAVQSGSSPFVAALKQIGIPGADHVMNAVVLTAVLSCLNSGLYSASRVLFVLARQREAPAQMLESQRTRRALPRDRVLLGGGISLRHHGRRRAEHRVLVPAQLVGRHRAVRLPADCVVADRVTPQDAAGEATGQDVVLPDAVDPDGCRDRRACWRRWRSTAPLASSSGSACCPGPWWSRCTSSPNALRARNLISGLGQQHCLLERQPAEDAPRRRR